MKYTKNCEANRSIGGGLVGTLVLGFPLGTAGGALVGNMSCGRKEKKGIVGRTVDSAKSVITPSTYIRK